MQFQNFIFCNLMKLVYLVLQELKQKCGFVHLSYCNVWYTYIALHLHKNENMYMWAKWGLKNRKYKQKKETEEEEEIKDKAYCIELCLINICSLNVLDC